MYKSITFFSMVYKLITYFLYMNTCVTHMGGFEYARDVSLFFEKQNEEYERNVKETLCGKIFG